jgi:hypothetical protein
VLILANGFFAVSEMKMVILTISYSALVLVELAHKRMALLYAVAMGVKADAVILSSAFGEVLPRLACEIEATPLFTVAQLAVLVDTRERN